MKNVLIVDDNLGFLYWLGETLAGARYQPWPALSTPEAVAIVRNKTLAQLDLLVVNPSLPGARRLIARLRSGLPDLKVMAVDPVNDRQVHGVDAWRARPESGTKSVRQEWLREIDRVVANRKEASHLKSLNHKRPHHKRAA